MTIAGAGAPDPAYMPAEQPGPVVKRLRTAGSAWSRPTDVVAALQRYWDQGTPLSDHLAGLRFTPVEVNVRHPKARDVSARFDEARSWAAEWNGRRAHSLPTERGPVGGRWSGTNSLVTSVAVRTFDELIGVLRAQETVARARAVLEQTRDAVPIAAPWVVDHPLQAASLAEQWAQILACLGWFSANDSRGRYLRQVDAPGVDTKFLAAHRLVLSDLLDLVLPPGRVDAQAPRGDLQARLGLLRKPQRIRVRLLDQIAWAGGLTDVEAPIVELANHPVPAANLLIVENETTFLALPPLRRTAAVFGSGWAAAAMRGLPWLDDINLLYWGDLDTHGFAILDHVRAAHPGARSVLMDSATLLHHREHWVAEDTPFARDLTKLTASEQAVCAELRTVLPGRTVRLEQERIRFGWAREALLAALE